MLLTHNKQSIHLSFLLYNQFIDFLKLSPHLLNLTNIFSSSIINVYFWRFHKFIWKINLHFGITIKKSKFVTMISQIMIDFEYAQSLLLIAPVNILIIENIKGHMPIFLFVTNRFIMEHPSHDLFICTRI